MNGIELNIGAQFKTLRKIIFRDPERKLLLPLGLDKDSEIRIDDYDMRLDKPYKISFWRFHHEIDFIQVNQFELLYVLEPLGELELLLLNMWDSSGFEYIFKYKNRIKLYRERFDSIDLFYDLTGLLFRDVQDTADGHNLSVEDCKVSVKSLLGGELIGRSNEGEASGN